MENKIYEKLQRCLNSLRNKTSFEPKIAIVLGSGLGDYANEIKVECEVPYNEIKDFPISTVQGHDGRFIFGYVNDIPVVCMKGRVHYYEGYDISDVVLPTRLMYMLGARKLILTNAAGGIDASFRPADFMLITDHIACFAPNPLIGPNLDKLGTRFPDMTNIYDNELNNLIRFAAKENDIALKEGVYVYLTGPSYETPAEIRMLRLLGAGAVGMSTVVEAIAARHCGMKVCGISCICNMAAGMSAVNLSHKEVQEAADIAAPKFKKLVTEAVIRMGKE